MKPGVFGYRYIIVFPPELIYTSVVQKIYLTKNIASCYSCIIDHNTIKGNTAYIMEELCENKFPLVLQLDGKDIITKVIVDRLTVEKLYQLLSEDYVYIHRENDANVLLYIASDYSSRYYLNYC